MTRQALALTAVVVVALLASPNRVAAQNTYTWTGATGGAWFTTGSWTGGTAGKFPGVDNLAGGNDGLPNDIALFNNPTANIGINMNTAVGLLQLGAINQAGATPIQIGNSSTTVNGVLQLNGVTINSVDNVLLATTGTGNITIANVNTGTGSQLMAFRLGNANGVFLTNTGTSVFINSNIIDGGLKRGFTVQGDGTTILNGTNSYSGVATVLAGGTLRFNTLNSIGGVDRRNTLIQNGGRAIYGFAFNQNVLDRISTASAGVVALAADSNNNLNFTTITGAVSLGAVGPVTYSGSLIPSSNVYRLGGGGGTLTVTSVLNDGVSVPRSLVVGGSGSGGTVILTNANTYLLGTTITQGTLQLGNGGVTGSILGNVVNNASLVFNRSDDITFNGIISGTGTLTKLGAGKLKLTKANTLPTTIIGQGLLELDFSAAGAPTSDILAGTSIVTFSGGSLNLLGKDGAANTQNFASTTFSAGAANISVTAGSGGTVALNLGTISRTGTATANVNLTSGFTVNGTGTPTNGILGGYFAVNGSDWATLDGSNNVVALAAAIYTIVTGGAAVPNDPTANVKITGAATLTPGVTTTINSLILTANFTGSITPAPILRIGSGGILVPAGNIQIGHSTTTKITAGVTDDAPGELIAHVASGATFSFNSGVNNNGTGMVSFTKSGPGSVSFGAGSGFTGPIVLNEGTLSYTNVASINGGVATAPIILRGGTIVTTGVHTRALVIEGDVTMNLAGIATTLTVTRFNSAISGSGTVIVNGATGSTSSLGSALQIGPSGSGSSTSNTYSGRLILRGGRLQAGSSNSGLAAAEIRVENDGVTTFGILDLNATSMAIDRLTGNGVVSGGGNTFFLSIGNSGGNSTFDGTIVNQVAIRKNGAGTFVLNSPSANTYTGNTEINGGVLQFNALTTLGPGNVARPLTISAGATAATAFALEQSFIDKILATSAGTLALAADTPNSLSFSQITGSLSLGAVGTATYSNSEFAANGSAGNVYRLGGGGGTLIFAPQIVDTASNRSLIVNGSGSLGTVILTADSTYTAGTTIATGTLQIGNGGTNGSIVGNVVTNGVLAFNRSDSSSYAANISGTGVVQKLGGGTLILSGTNTHLGGTVVSNGILSLASTNALPTVSEIVLQSGSTLQTTTGITAFNAGPLRVSGAATISLADAIHTLNFGGFDGTSAVPLTIVGWAGVEGGSGTKGQLLFSNIGSQPNTDFAAFLSTVQFTTFPTGATFIGSGPTFELVPLAAVPEPGFAFGIATCGLLVFISRPARLRLGLAQANLG